MGLAFCGALFCVKAMFEEEFAASSKLDFSKFAKVVRGKDGSFSLENEDGTLSSPLYAFAYVTIGFDNTGDEATGFLSGEYAMGQYDTDGCPLDMSECTTDKRELINGIAEVPMNAEDPNKTGNILLEPGQTRELVFIYLLSDESVYVRTDDEAAERDGVKNYIEIVENYFIDAYTETDCRYTIDVNSGLGPFVHYDVSDIVNDFFTEHK